MVEENANLAPNPSFEIGSGTSPQGWTLTNGVWDVSDSHTGQKSVLLRVPGGVSGQLRSDWIPIEHNTTYIFTAWSKTGEHTFTGVPAVYLGIETDTPSRAEDIGRSANAPVVQTHPDWLQTGRILVLDATSPVTKVRIWIAGSEQRVDDVFFGHCSVPKATPDEAYQRSLGVSRLNYYRQGAGVPPVVEDSCLSYAGQRHLEYLDTNAGDPSTIGLAAHGERADKPGFSWWGWSGQGNLGTSSNAANAIDLFAATFYHRVSMLHAGTKRVGIGFRVPSNPTFNSTLVTANYTPSEPSLTIFPFPGQRNVPLAMALEIPDPLQGIGHYPAGYPVTIQDNVSDPSKYWGKLTVTNGRLVDQQGSAVPTYLIAGYPQAFNGEGWAALIAKDPLQPETQYSASIAGTADGADYRKDWSFTTGCGTSQLYLELAPDYDAPNGHFFTQTGRIPGIENGTRTLGRGFGVYNNANAAFWDEFLRLGGVSSVGFPISCRFNWNGFTVQAMQRVVFQWNSASKQVSFVNVFDLLSQAGKDDWLFSVRQVPKPLPSNFDAGKSTQQIVDDRLALLNENESIKQAYFDAAGDPIQLNGLPTSRVTDMGNNYALRAQRIVFQQWKEDVPWAAAGQVTVALGGSIAAEAGLLPEEPLQPAS